MNTKNYSRPELGRLFLCGFPAVGKHVPVFFDWGVGRPCGTSVDDVAEVFEDVYSAAVAGYGQ